MAGRYSTGLAGVESSAGGVGAGGRASPRARLAAWLAVAAWTAVILALSRGSFSAEVTGSRLAALLQLLGIGLEAIEPIHFFVRKGAHLLVYAVLGLLALRAARLSFAPPLPLPVALALALSVAALDEAHQATTATRTGSPWDVGLDAGGAVLGALLWRRLGAGPTR
jgi:VanZ family protein